MLTEEIRPELIKDYKRIFETYHSSMLPNRKTGREVDRYFRNRYPYQVYENEDFKNIVESNIIENEHSRNKLQNGIKPVIKSYIVDNVLIGIDFVSGEFHVESKDMNKSIPIYDDLFVYRGLDEEDLGNYFLVAEYIKLTHN